MALLAACHTSMTDQTNRTSNSINHFSSLINNTSVDHMLMQHCETLNLKDNQSCH
ncbi:hypothetical protein DERF_006925 [Dermatophagoides farinae]|uniref:Uncharacterized protein n=1 Tax=Dermatophagoides farinae TaxID=6954 RepID=A0A922I164_DERFA|nr:hypothetical protein DERF_006925 [Dermatophagoides farinae]